MQHGRDNPWRRLFWLLPLSAVVSLLSLEGFFLLLQGGTYAPPPPKPVDVEVVELPPSPPPLPAPAVVEPPPAVMETPPPAPAPPPVAAEAPAPVAETPLLAAPPPPARAAETRAPAPTPPPVSAPVVAVPEAPQAASATPAPKHGPQITTAPPQEVTRGGFPGMMTEPMAPAAPPTKEEWDRLAKLYNTGDDHQGFVEAERGPGRAARSTRIAPLTKEEDARLAKTYNTGDDHQGMVEAERAPVRSARSKPSRPLTKEEYAAQTKLYWTGMDPDGSFTPDVREAGLRGALSFEASLVTPTAQIDYGARFHAASSDRMAIAMVQPPPQIPAEISVAKPVVVVARFHVAADGSTTVQLVSPAPEPRLNDALLAGFQDWRFEPASRAGRAVDSSLDYRLTLAPALGVKVASTVTLLETQNPAEVARRGTLASPIEAPPARAPGRFAAAERRVESGRARPRGA